MDSLIQVIDEWTTKITALAWTLLLLTWSIAWTLRGVPVPLPKIKKIGGSLAEDAVWAAFWLASGSLVFKIIVYVASVLANSIR
ncbi:MAG: DNA import protein CedA1 [Acidilobaceae archaeon]